MNDWIRGCLVVGLSVGCIGGLVACQTPGQSEEAVADEPAAMTAEESVAEEKTIEEETAEGETAEEAVAEESAPSGSVQRWSREGLLENRRMEEFTATANPDFANPGTTDWREAEVPAALRDETFPAPGGALVALQQAVDIDAQLGMDLRELTARAYIDGDEAGGALLLWGFKDDSLAGKDIMVMLEADGDAWRVASMQERFHCVRGTVGELCM